MSVYICAKIIFGCLLCTLLYHNKYTDCLTLLSIKQVEAELKTSPLVENICVHGNSLSTFLVALISPNVKALRQLAMQVGLNPVHLSFEQLCENRHIVQAATEQLIRHAKHCNLNKVILLSLIILLDKSYCILNILLSCYNIRS